MANDTEKLNRYFRELTKWGKRVAESIDQLEQSADTIEGGGASRGPGGPPPPPDLGGDA